MKNIMLAIMGFMLVPTALWAQFDRADNREKFNIGVKGGLNYSNNYDSKGDKFTADTKVGFAAGGFISIPFTQLLGFQVEAMYSQKGYKEVGEYLGSVYTLTRTTDYLDIPLLVAIKPAKYLTIFAGPQYSYLMKQKESFENPLTTFEQKSDFKNDNIRKNTLGFMGGFDINVGKFVIGARAGWDIMNNNGDGTSTNPRYKNAWTQTTIGLAIL
ncbi:MAG: PorT family protein [Cytophagaceae bacterium]|nr:PorT family protein [Cytophagaceae bacterium]MBK9932864.1 PorT family protein [Cytophagaceae bacterium]MBL0303447.1 PorT family protein [Cytophagaceae bacterium]MBL0326275.1 PorT family protein [Cytophagaceae bacterium]